VTSGCVNFADERSADLKRVGATSSSPEFVANGDDPLDGYAYFAINTQGTLADGGLLPGVRRLHRR